jgi:hypothetical protein
MQQARAGRMGSVNSDMVTWDAESRSTKVLVLPLVVISHDSLLRIRWSEPHSDPCQALQGRVFRVWQRQLARRIKLGVRAARVCDAFASAEARCCILSRAGCRVNRLPPAGCNGMQQDAIGCNRIAEHRAISANPPKEQPVRRRSQVTVFMPTAKYGGVIGSETVSLYSRAGKVAAHRADSRRSEADSCAGGLGWTRMFAHSFLRLSPTLCQSFPIVCDNVCL